MQTIYKNKSTINLGQALKAAGITESGSAAKALILSGKVYVNGQICLQRGKKLNDSDEISYGNSNIKILSSQ